MATKYLDKDGVQTLWNKMKEYVDNQVTTGFNINKVYPVGAIYMSYASTNPSSLFGGTWVQIQNRFLYAVGSKSVGTTGGEENHTLSWSEMPNHTHDLLTFTDTGVDNSTICGPLSSTAKGKYWGVTGDYFSSSSRVGYKSTAYNYNSTRNIINAAGSGSAHNNMPPYLVVYMWRRTA